jgi:cytochrome P450
VEASLLVGSASDPAPVLAHLREHDPVHWIPGLDAWLVTRHEDVRLLFSSSCLTADARAWERYEPSPDPRAERLSTLPFRSATAESESWGRRLVSAALTPRAVARMEARVGEVVERFAAPLRGRRGRVDLMADFVVPVSLLAIGRILGIPPKDEDERHFRELAVRATELIRPFSSTAKRQLCEAAALELGGYVVGLVEECRQAPRDDFLSDLLRASSSSGTPCEDVARVVTGLVAAGAGTASVAGGRSLRTLLQHPDQMELLRSDRALGPDAVEELLRHGSGIMVMPRYVVEDVAIRDRVLRKGQLVLLSILAANRDPRVFPEPDRLDLRRDAREALSFGFGAHYCIGANIARMELRLMIDAALDFLRPGARLLEEEIRWSHKGVMSQIKSLPVELSGANVTGVGDREPGTAACAPIA